MVVTFKYETKIYNVGIVYNDNHWFMNDHEGKPIEYPTIRELINSNPVFTHFLPINPVTGTICDPVPTEVILSGLDNASAAPARNASMPGGKRYRHKKSNHVTRSRHIKQTHHTKCNRSTSTKRTKRSKRTTRKHRK